MRKKRHSERGTAFIEAALLLPLLLLICVGTADFSRLFYTGMEVASAAGAGVRYGALKQSNASDITGMQNAAKNDVNISGMTATASKSCQCEDGTSVACTGKCASQGLPLIYVRVTTQATFQTLVNYPMIPASVTVTRTAAMRAR
jgi:Flp pilus assembly protein TadG